MASNIFDNDEAVLSRAVLDTEVLNENSPDPQSGGGRVTQCQAKRNAFPSANKIDTKRVFRIHH